MTDQLNVDLSALEEFKKQADSPETDIAEANATAEVLDEPSDAPSEEFDGETSVKEEKATKESEEDYAKSLGWDPAGEFSAGEWLRRGELLKEISTTKKELKKLVAALKHQQKYMNQQQEVGYKKALEDLHIARYEAIQRGDVDSVNYLDQEIQKSANELNTIKKEELPPELLDFRDRNLKWLEQDPSYTAQQIKEFAFNRDNQLGAFHLPTEEHLARLEKDIRNKFPDYFNEAARTARSNPAVSMSTATPRGNGKRGSEYDLLTPEQKRICAEFEYKDIMSKSEYIKQLKELGEFNKEV